MRCRSWFFLITESTHFGTRLKIVRMSQPQTESYTAAKGGIAALTHALAVSLAGKVRVNSISPGWIDTACTVYEGSDANHNFFFSLFLFTYSLLYLFLIFLCTNLFCG